MAATTKFSLDKIEEVESFLATNNYLSGAAHPDVNDSEIFQALSNKVPDQSATPNLFHWFLFISAFKPEVIKSWAEAKAAPAKGGKKDTKKDEKKSEAKADDDDLFGSDDDDDSKMKELAAKKKAEAEGKKKKPVVIAKSVVVFDVKVFEQEQNLDELAQRILKIELDGLAWKTQYNLVEIAYGMKKLQMGCTVEDDKVLTDDIFDQILAWEDEVQSVDIVSFQKV